MSDTLIVMSYQDLLALLAPIVGGLVSVLLVINAFFIARLVKKLDNLDRLVLEKIPLYEERLSTMGHQVEDLKGSLRDVFENIRDLTNLTSRIAVLESKLNAKH